MIIDKLNESILLELLEGKSAITFDIAPLHTGIVEYKDNKLQEYHFKLSKQDSEDVFKEIKQRRDFKDHIKPIVAGKHYDFCLVEGIYGGESYTTLLQLANLNTVVDELVFEGVFQVDTFYRQTQVEWAADNRQLYKQAHKPTSKVETQNLLEYMECGYYLKHKDDTSAQKIDECFEDICDAYGMLYSIVAKQKAPRPKKEKKLSIKDVKMQYVQYAEELDLTRGKQKFGEVPLVVTLDLRNIEDSIITNIKLHPDALMVALLPPSKLGLFGVKHKFRFFDTEDEGWLYFYRK